MFRRIEIKRKTDKKLHENAIFFSKILHFVKQIFSFLDFFCNFFLIINVLEDWRNDK